MGCRTLDEHLARFFFRYAAYVHRFRWLFFLCPIALTATLSYGITLLEVNTINDTEYVFTPIYSRGKEERNILNKWWPLQNDHFIPGKFLDMKYYMEILVTAKDGGSVLRNPMLLEMEKLNSFILDNYTVTSFDGLDKIGYRDLCMSWAHRCYENGHLEMLLQRADLKSIVKMTYPRGGRGDVPVYFASLIGGVILNETTSEIVKAQAIRLVYNFRENRTYVNHKYNLYSRRFMLSMEQYLLETYDSDLISVAFAHSESLTQGLVENSKLFMPNFVVSFSLLFTFATICSFVILPKNVEIDDAGNKRHRSCVFPRIDWVGVRSKPLLATAGVISAGMAIVSSFGLLLLLGMEYNVIASVMPFLVISIGVDDMFIMSSSWHRTAGRGECTEVRLGRALADAAVSITITSLTDALSFAIGCVSVLPGVWIFCSFAAAAVAFDFLYQVTFFAAAMSFLGDAESDGRHCLAYARCPDAQATSPSCLGWYLWSGSSATASRESHQRTTSPLSTSTTNSQKALVTDCPDDDESSLPDLSLCHAEDTIVSRFFRDYYGPILLHPLSKCIVVLSIGAYIAGAIWGCLNIKEGLNPGNLIVNEHYLSNYFKKVEILWAQGQQAHITIGSPPRLENFERRSELLRMLGAFENNRFCMGPEATMFWLREFINYKNELGGSLENTTDVWEADVRYWLENTGGRKNWEADMVWVGEGDKAKLRAYRFQIGLTHYVTPNDHREATESLRLVADSFPQFNVSVYHELFTFADQYMIILPTTLRNIAIAIGCMILVSILLIPSVSCSVLIIIAIISIDLGVLGYMALWNVNLDAISMITIIMSIGFAVDLTAHISYAYVKAEEPTARERAISSLQTLGWPVFQGAFSTIIGIMVLSRVKAYMMLTFFKTVFLVIAFGLIHSLVFLPVLLTLLLPDSFCNSAAAAEDDDPKAPVNTDCFCISNTSDLESPTHKDKCATRKSSLFLRRSEQPWDGKTEHKDRPTKRKIRPGGDGKGEDSWTGGRGGRRYPNVPPTAPAPKPRRKKDLAKALSFAGAKSTLGQPPNLLNIPADPVSPKKALSRAKSLPKAPKGL